MTATGLSPAASPSASASPVMRLISGAGPSGISGLAPGAEAEDALCVAARRHAKRQHNGQRKSDHAFHGLQLLSVVDT